MQNQYNLLLKKLIKHSIWGVIIQCLVITSMFASEVNKETNTRESNALSTDILRPEITVTGTVKSADDGSTLPGVNITIKGTTLGTTTDTDGKYTIRVPDGDAILVFSFIGFLPQE